MTVDIYLPLLLPILVSLVALLLPSIDAGLAAPARKVAKARPRPSPAPAKCEMPKFRIVVDVGHTPDSYGALSARNERPFTIRFGPPATPQPMRFRRSVRIHKS